MLLKFQINDIELLHFYHLPSTQSWHDKNVNFLIRNDKIFENLLVIRKQV